MLESRDLLQRRFGALFSRLSTWQVRRPFLFLALGVVFLGLGVWLTSKLELRTRYDQLLPDDQASVTEFRRVMARVGANTKVAIVLEAADRAGHAELRAFGDALVPRLAALGKPTVVDVADGTQQARAFLGVRAGLFAKREELLRLDQDLEERWDFEVGEALDLNLADEPAPISYESIVKRFGLEHERERFPDGYFQSEDGKALIVLCHTGAAPGDLARSQEAYEKIRREVESAERELKPQIRISYAGDIVTSLAEYGAIHNDLVQVGVLGVSLVLVIVLLFFMRVRALLALGFTIACGMAWTFGITELTLGHLNVATGFLFSIIAGNGINSGIIYMARYFEERRAGRSAADALTAAHARTAPSTLTVAIASAAAYGSLGASNFRVFRHFAVIGSTGMLMCWLATALVLPSVLLLLERVRPFQGNDDTTWSRLRWRGLRYDALFGLLVQRAPRAIVALGILLAALGCASLLPYLRSDPMEYDMRKMHSNLPNGTQLYRASQLTERVLGGRLDSGMVVLAHRLDQVQALKRQLLARRDAAPRDQKPFDAVHTLLDFVPDDQASKIPILHSIRARLLRAKSHIKPEDWRKIEPLLPPSELTPHSLSDLPEDLARPFTENDGTRGRVVLIEPTAGVPDTDLRYVMRWADSFRETHLPNGEVLLGSGRPVIFADMLQTMQRDIPVSIALSLGITSLAVVLLFRRWLRIAQVLGALLLGLSWMVLYMAVLGFKINFFNFVALPITFGIGVDYAVNLVRRCDSDPEQGILGALRNTGGPIILCSLTTILGYSALIRSINQAIRGLGVLAVVGEVVCLLAALLVLPSALSLRAGGRPSTPSDSGDKALSSASSA